jgi:cell division inhibitor SepF
MGVFNRVMNFIGFGEEEEAERDEAEATETDSASETRRTRGTVVSIHAQKTSKVTLSEPQHLDDVTDMVEQLRARRSVVINLQCLTEASAQRVVDVLHGAVCAFNGKMVKIGVGIYLCAPDNYEVNGTIDADRFIDKDVKDGTAEGRI